MDYAFVPGVTRWEQAIREMLRAAETPTGFPSSAQNRSRTSSRYLRREGFSADDLIIASHATNEGILFMDLDAVTSGEPATYEILEQVDASGTIEIPAGVRKATTRVHIKG
jgi:hypothetical protein